MTKKSYCPIYQSLSVIGDKWSLLIIRDIMIHRKRHFNDFLTSDEKIAKSTLSNCLKKLVENKIIIKVPDLTHKQKNKYVLTLKGIKLTPVIADLYLFSGSLDDINLSLEDNRIVRMLMDNNKFSRMLMEDHSSLIRTIETGLINEVEKVFDDYPELLIQH